MPQLALVAKHALKTVQLHSPAIMTGLGVAGVVSTAVLTARAAVQAQPIMQEVWEGTGNHPWPDKDTPATRLDMIRAVWPLFVPPALTGIATIGCIIGAQSVNVRRQAALASAFTLTEGAFQEYKDQVADALTKPAKDKIETAVAQKKVDDNPPTSEQLIPVDKQVLCLDLYTGRYFHSTQEKIRQAQNDVNERILSGPEGFIAANEFYMALGLDQSIVGEQVGFSLENLCDVNFNTALAEGGVPCLTLAFRSLPNSGYYSLR